MKVNIDSDIYKLDKYCDIIVDTAIAIMDKRDIHDYRNIANVLEAVFDFLCVIDTNKHNDLSYGTVGNKGYVHFLLPNKEAYIFYDLECLDCIDKFHDLIFGNDIEFGEYFFDERHYSKYKRLHERYNIKTNKKYKFSRSHPSIYYGFGSVIKYSFEDRFFYSRFN